jgi:hypothetical protein
MRAGLWWFKVGVMGKRLDEEAKGEYREEVTAEFGRFVPKCRPVAAEAE